MRLKEITSQHRNDFHWIGECEHCGKTKRYGDGYADDFYCLRVIPARHCSECGLNSYGLTTEQAEAVRVAHEATT